MKIRIPGKIKHIAIFLLLAFLCYQAHQWVRHFTGAIVCGGFGSMTFTVAEPKGPCADPTILALSGPALTYGLAWLGLFLLRRQRTALFGYALIFASFGPVRFIQALTGRGDELGLAEQWFGISSRVVVALAIIVINLPPAVAAFRAIANRRRTLTFLASLLLPLPLLFAMLFGDKFLFQTSDAGRQLGAVLGIWVTVLVTDALAAGLLILFLPGILKSETEAVRTPPVQ